MQAGTAPRGDVKWVSCFISAKQTKTMLLDLYYRCVMKEGMINLIAMIVKLNILIVRVRSMAKMLSAMLMKK